MTLPAVVKSRLQGAKLVLHACSLRDHFKRCSGGLVVTRPGAAVPGAGGQCTDGVGAYGECGKRLPRRRFSLSLRLISLIAPMAAMLPATGFCDGPNIPPKTTKLVDHVSVQGYYFTHSGFATSDGSQWGGFQGASIGSYLSSIYIPFSILAGGANTSDCDCKCKKGDPVDTASGNKSEQVTDFAVPGEMGLNYTRYYYSQRSIQYGPMGWHDNLSYRLDLSCGTTDVKNCNTTTLFRPDGSAVSFYPVGWMAGTPPPAPGVYSESGNGVATLTVNADGSFTVNDETGLVLHFPVGSNGAGQIDSIRDVSGVGWALSYPDNYTTVVTHSNGASFSKHVAVLWDATNTVATGTMITVTDPAGNVYTYQTGSNTAAIQQVNYPGSPAEAIQYKYSPTLLTQMLEMDYNGVPYAFTSYDSSNRATATYLADGSENTRIGYGSNTTGATATITNALGFVSTQQFAGGKLSSISNEAVATCGATTSARSYDINGHLQQETDNNGNVTQYTYAANGQLQSKTEAYGTPQARTTTYTWDSNAWLNRPLSVTVQGYTKTTYTYNAQNRLASVAVTNLSGNGSANQTLTTTYNYTLYANGMVQTMTVTHPSPNNADVDTSQYDNLGNLTSFTDGAGHTTSYGNYTALGQAQHITGPNGDVTDYTYDARGRVLTATTYPNGVSATWNYAYDGFGLLASKAAPNGETTTWTRNSLMRVTAITHNDKDGPSTEAFSYDADGDVTAHIISRGSVVGMAESFAYDAMGRVYQHYGQNNQVLTYAYDGNGNVLSVTDAVGHTTTHQYDALNRVIQTTEGGGGSPPMPATPPLNAPASSHSGAYTVSWNSTPYASYYILQEQFNTGSWATVQTSSALNWNAASKPNGNYSYRVQACDATGCSAWSSVSTVQVAIPTAPTSAPALNVPANNSNGSYAVSWTAVGNSSSYTLQEQINGGGWNTVQSSGALGWSASGKGSATYGYQVQACNAIGCGPWSAVGTVTVALPQPPATPALSVPSSNATGSYTVSWSGVGGAAGYNLQEQVNGGGWSTILSGSAATSWSASGEGNGSYGYQVQACNAGGCSPWSGVGTTSVFVPVPIAINGQSYAQHTLIKTVGSAAIGFTIVNGNSWQVYGMNTAGSIVKASGAVPANAVSVQYTWVGAGVPASDSNDAGGSVTNPAASPVPISSNPNSFYRTNSFTNTSPSSGHMYQLRVDFYNAAGQNISSSTCTLTAEVGGSLT